MNFLIVFVAQYVFLISIVIFVLYATFIWLKQRKKFMNFLILSLASFSIAFIIAKILGHFIYNPRPFVTEHVRPLFIHAADNGFPSDHMLLTMTIASIIFVYNKKLGILLTIISVCIGIARIMANVHHVVDIVGSGIIAIGAVLFSHAFYLFIKRLNITKLKFK